MKVQWQVTGQDSKGYRMKVQWQVITFKNSLEALVG